MTHPELVQALTVLGLRPGMDVLVHSSLSSIGWVEGGPDALVAALVETVRPGGTVLFPALTGTKEDSAANPPRADYARPPARWVGKVPAAACLHEGAVRSVHPTHSVVAIGPRARALTDGHERCDSPCGVGSPYHRLALGGGHVLLLGCDHQSNTSLHMVEEIGGAPYHLLPDVAEGTVRLPDGEARTVTTAIHQWIPRDLTRLEPRLVAAVAQRTGHVGRAECRLVDAEAQLRLGVEALSEDRNFFLIKPASRSEGA